MTPLEFGRLVTAERAKLQISMEKAAALGGVSHVTWRRVERGQRVYARTFHAIDEAFGLTAGTAFAVYNGQRGWPVRDRVTLDDVHNIFAPKPTSLSLRAMVTASVAAGRMRILGGVEPLDFSEEAS